MSKYFYIPLFLIILSCNQSPSQIEKNYIQNLEEKNRVLEKKLKELKSKTTPIIKRIKNKPDSLEDYVTIGSTMDEVIEVMGQPTSYMVTAPEARKFQYGFSTIYFYQGKVISYENLEGNLKIKVKY